MAQTIKIRRSTTAGAVPASLASGEIAVNETDGKLFTRTAAGAVRTTDLNVASAGQVREMLTASRTYYVATTGSDSNDGKTASAPFLTIQKAINSAAALDMSIYSVVIQVADGTYNSQNMAAVNYVGAGPITIRGNTTTPSNVVINGGTGFYSACTQLYVLDSFKVTGTWGLVLYNGGFVQWQNLEFGTMTNAHINVNAGARAECTGSYKISGNASAHWQADYATIKVNSKTITIVNTPAFSVAFAWCDRAQGMIDCMSNTFSGAASTATVRYNNSAGAVFTNAAGTAYLPGGSAGVVSYGGQYI
jgi:hypothetical protein